MTFKVIVKVGQWLVCLLLLSVNWVVYSYHLGVYPRALVKQEADREETGVRAAHIKPSAEWIDKKTYGVHQLILSGPPFERGLLAGKLTQPLLLKEENELVSKMNGWVPNRVVLQGLILFSINWFDGIQKYLEPWATEEMFGVAQSAPHQYDYLADGFTRQVAYHGLHEVGQLLVDQKGDDMGCTVVATPYKSGQIGKKGWILGRNFDFEGGRVFDEDKILKWVFPDQGNAYVSVIWAGMVGAVTAVNENGLYISINAAGTKDFKRLGTPSTLLLLKALQFSKNLDEALAVLRDGQMFITDIFVLMDATSGRVVRAEKSPLHTEVIELSSPVAVTNHLASKYWSQDAINAFRKNELTSAYRETRAVQLVSKLDQEKLKDPRILESRILSILRDKGEEGGRPLELANRRAIDPLIAAHSVIYNGVDRILYVSQGPSLSGAYSGFDLKASFRERKPVLLRYLPADPLVTPVVYSDIHTGEKQVALAEKEFLRHQCAEGFEILRQVTILYRENADYLQVLGDGHACKGNKSEARESWQKALARFPAYAKDTRALQEKLK